MCAASWKTTPVSMVLNAKTTATDHTTAGAILEQITAGQWQAQIEVIRQTYIDTLAKAGLEVAKNAIKPLKEKLPGVMFSGTFSRRKANALQKHSGLLGLDFDHLGRALAGTKATLAADAHTLAVFTSPGGDGLKVIVPVTATDAATHTSCFRAAEQYYRDEFGLTIDPSGKDVSRLCFVSFDSGLFIRDESDPAAPFAPVEVVAQELPSDQPKADPKPDRGTENPDDTPSAELVASALRSIDPACEYCRWVEIAMALKAWDDAAGFKLFSAWSELAPSRTPKLGEPSLRDKWDSFKGTGTTIATLFHHAKKAGWEFPNFDRQERMWAPEVADPAQLETKYGPPYFSHVAENTGKTVYDGLNESYFAGLHASQNVELWEPLERTFYKYDHHTGLYSDVTSDVVKQELSESILAMGRAVQLMGLIKDRSDRRLAAIVSQLKGVVEKRDAFSKKEQFIHLANGVLVFKNNEADLMEFSSDYRSRNQSPIAFDPEATCDRFLNDLVLPAVHAEDVVIIQKYLGLCLLGRNIIQRFLILDGEAGRGKSQLAIVFQHLVGMLNCTQLRTEHLHERFELYRFLKKTLLIGVDVPADFLSTKGATVIKGLVGGDIMDAEQKNGTGCFPVEGTFCIVVTSNSRLRVRLEGDVGAWRRRLLIVRYEAPPPGKKIPDFGKHLVAVEGSGILNWALQGLAALLQDVAEIGDIRLTGRQSGTVDSLLAESDSLRQFLKDRVAKSDEGDLTVNEIVQAYAEYCPTKGWNPMPITVIQRQVEGLMLELFQTVKNHCVERSGKQQKGFTHVTFK